MLKIPAYTATVNGRDLAVSLSTRIPSFQWAGAAKTRPALSRKNTIVCAAMTQMPLMTAAHSMLK
nr:MAG TPA: hypothetical protein [Caudoviricetes sp.]